MRKKAKVEGKQMKLVGFVMISFLHSLLFMPMKACSSKAGTLEIVIQTNNNIQFFTV